ncbi:MAG: formylglycine-generating enzyme family protein [Planctomycetota bacterium]|nr:formylglycine-generating enzyme family protein [Planctomycetota bacterium]
MRWVWVCLLAAMLVSPLGSAETPATALSAIEAKSRQQASADRLKIPARLTNSLGMELAMIPAGQFMRGSPPGEEGRRADETRHPVRLTKAFYMGTTEVTQAQWKKVMDGNPSFFTGDALPVETVTWEDAVKFCRKLSDKEGVRYRLPTEAEWEYACRAGTTTPFHTGPTITTDQANYHGSYTYGKGQQGKFREETTDAGSFAPNAWGLHDMHGNVWEWCADWYGAYPREEATDPHGPDQGEFRVIRSGCWINFPAICRAANRGKTVPVSWNFHFGFRVVRDLN